MDAKLNIKHDYLTLTIKHAGLRTNLTVSRRGEKISASGPWTPESFKAVANAFLAKTKASKGCYSDLMKGIQSEAERATDFTDFVKKIANRG